MENDVLKNKIAPWQEKGRWYHAHITESGLDQANSDKYLIDNLIIILSSNYVTLNDLNHKIIDYQLVYNSWTTSTTRTITKQILTMDSGYTRLAYAQPSYYTKLDLDLWIFVK